MATEKRLIDAKRKFVLNSGNMTGHIMCVENEYATVFDRFAKMICTFNLLDAPTVDAVEVVHGRWEPHYESFVSDPDLGIFGGDYQTGWECSVCGRYEYDKEPYCNCGAKMDGDGNG